MKIRIKIPIVTLLLLYGHYSFAQVNSLSVKVFTLPNGLTVYLNQDKSLPKVMGAVVVKAGSKYDPQDATGMGHYLEHMLFKGTTDLGTSDYEKEKPYLDEITTLYDQYGVLTDKKKREEIQKKINEAGEKAAAFAIPNELDRMLSSIGGKDANAFTGSEEIVFHNSFAPNEMEKWLSLYAHRFMNPVFRLFQPELEIVYEEKNMGSDNMQTAIFEKFIRELYRVHPYGTPTIGTTEHLKNPSLSKMYKYYNTYFVPNNMALILTGNFDGDVVTNLVTRYFSAWKKGEVPVYPKYEEKPFKGKEKKVVHLSPIKIGILGFRSVPLHNEDENTLEVVNYLLSNSNETGILDSLRTNNLLMAAGAQSTHQNDLGAELIFFLPKIIGESLAKTEKMVLGGLERVKNGAFRPDMLEAAKNQLKVQYYKSMENPSDRAFMIAQCFSSGQKWDDYLKYPSQIDKITMDDLKRVASKYYGSDYLDFQSKRGIPKKDKIKKPGFTPVKPNLTAKSSYAEQFNKIPSTTPKGMFVDFNKDFMEDTIGKGQSLMLVPNTVNDIFNLSLRYEYGEDDNNMLTGAVEYISKTGSENLKGTAFKSAMSALGCEYYMYTDERYTYINLSGLEKNFEASLKLLNQLLITPEKDKTRLTSIVNDEKLNRKLETADPDAISALLDEYLYYKTESGYLKRLPLDAYKNLTTDTLISVFKTALKYPVSIKFSGKTTFNMLKIIIKDNLPIAGIPYKTSGKLEKPKMVYEKPVIYFLNRKDARQSHISFYADALPFSIDKNPALNAFNAYFGGDMSAIVFQEIRELRSLAYSAGCSVSRPEYKNLHCELNGYIGCQADKTNDAVDAMLLLIKEMPQKPERMEALRSGLKSTAFSSRPTFRNLGNSVEFWRNLGYTDDPSKSNLAAYDSLKFEDILSFYKSYIQKLPVSLAIVGNKKNFDLNALRKYGEVIELKETDFRKR